MATGFEWLSMVMFFGFFVMLMTGYPVAFSFAGTAMVFGLIGLGLDAFEFSRVNLLPSRWFSVMSDFTLLAIPFFIYMGAILEKSGLAEDLLETSAMLFGPLRGGLALHGRLCDRNQREAGKVPDFGLQHTRYTQGLCPFL